MLIGRETGVAIFRGTRINYPLQNLRGVDASLQVLETTTPSLNKYYKTNLKWLKTKGDQRSSKGGGKKL